jgi:tetratricopeptide (TPR) repeat protein
VRKPDRARFNPREGGALLVLLAMGALVVAACGWEPSRPFDRNAPAVDKAIVALDAGDAAAATQLLTEYLSTGPCADGNIGIPDLVKKRPNGTIDLGLSLFAVAESYGRRFGEEEIEAGVLPEERSERAQRVACALHVVRAIAEDDAQSIESRARARYLQGNLHFLAGQYEDAVHAYDQSLELAPGREHKDGSPDDAMDALGRDAAYNRAIAMRRIQDKKNQDAGASDASSDGGQGKDSGGDSGGDSGPGDSGGDSGGGGGNDGGDAGADAAENDSGSSPPPKGQDAGPPPPPRADQDDRMLDQLEHAPTVQQEAARRAHKAVVRGMVDK